MPPAGATGVGFTLRDIRSPIISVELPDLAGAREGEATTGESSKRLISGASDLGAAVVRVEEVDRLEPCDVPTSRGGMLGPRMFERGSGCGKVDLDSFLVEVLLGPALDEEDFLVLPEVGAAEDESPFLLGAAQKRRS